MNTVLAALDTSPSAGEVLDTARRVARLTDATVIALHVRGHAGQVVTGLSSMADQAGGDDRDPPDRLAAHAEGCRLIAGKKTGAPLGHLSHPRGRPFAR